MAEDDVKRENKRNYRKLIVSLEASQGILNLLIAVCDDRNLRERLIQQYENELKAEGFLCYRVRVRTHDPSLTYALRKLVESDINLQQKQPAVITVLGVEDLLSVRLDAPKSEQERFFGYLQWTREALRQFHFPVVLWVSDAVVTSLSKKAPDFWSWRGGVFWFARESNPVEIHNIGNSNINYGTFKTVTKEVGGLPLEEILRLIDNIEAQGKDSPLLSTLYDSLGQVYQQRYDNSENRKLAIAAYEKAIALQTKLNLKADLASSWENLGNLYFERRHNSQKAENCYGKALAIYQEIGDKNGEANTLQAIGDVLQFLKRSDEALSRYEQALSFYREIGDRLGEANTLQAIGDVLQFLKRSDEALSRYEQALSFYREIGDRLGEANTLKAIGDVLQFLDRRDEALSRYEQALSFYREIGDRLGEANTLQAIGDVLQFLKRSDEALSRYEQALSFYREIGARLGEANTLQAIGDVLQFLKRSDEALSRYEQALSFYREIGARLGEANVLQELGKLEDDLKQSLEYIQQAQNLYQQIGDVYSQSRNLIYFLAEVQLEMGDKTAAINSLILGQELATKINYQPFQKRAQEKLAEIENNG